jgi:hypothetical protein
VSELRRWSEEGATAYEISLLEASQREHAPPKARMRTVKALGLAAALTTVATTTTAGGTTAAATKAGLGVLTKILVISLLGGEVVAGSLAVREWRQIPAPSNPAVSPKTTESAAVLPSKTLLQPSTSGAIASSVHVEPAARGVPSTSTDDRLSREVTALELARSALNTHNPNAALGLLDRYRAQFPVRALASEETVLRVQALLATGDRIGAQSEAAAYSAEYPDGPYTRWLKELAHAER